jgi:hypothetical protein
MHRTMYVAVAVRREVGLTRAQANIHFLFTRHRSLATWSVHQPAVSPDSVSTQIRYFRPVLSQESLSSLP